MLYIRVTTDLRLELFEPADLKLEMLDPLDLELELGGTGTGIRLCERLALLDRRDNVGGTGERGSISDMP
jgi:hypothetical protein